MLPHPINTTMSTSSSFTNSTTLFTTSDRHRHWRSYSLPAIRASFPGEENLTHRRNIISKVLVTSLALVAHNSTPPALAENWGTRSFLRERFFEPGLSPEDAVARIRQTAEGLHSIRHMLETMSWRYVIFYIRLKQAYLSQDLTNAMSTLPESRRKSYVKTANELVDNMAEVFITYFTTGNLIAYSNYQPWLLKYYTRLIWINIIRIYYEFINMFKFFLKVCICTFIITDDNHNNICIYVLLI